jgi:hypothetical protein
MVNLKSSVTKKGRYVTQILHFIGGEKRTFEGRRYAQSKTGTIY